MGNKTSTTEEVTIDEKEMKNSLVYKSEGKASSQYKTLLNLDELSDMCQELEENIVWMSKAIPSVIFEEGSFDGERNSDFLEEDGVLERSYDKTMSASASARGGLEIKIQEMTRCIQVLIRELIGQLDSHARSVGSCDNIQLMSLVKDLVGNVNNYMTMLMRYMRKLHRLLSENETGQKRYNKKFVYDIIQDSQDVDAMLVELANTEKEREELEKDAIAVLVIYKDFKSLGDIGKDDIDENVRTAAESIVCGLDKIETRKL